MLKSEMRVKKKRDTQAQSLGRKTDVLSIRNWVGDVATRSG